ncbi:hypothetical protein J7E68_01480 [Microbacterium sp. ISL-103]|uniref:hypothetical protein n=1 Tax=Microbacterium sp. ISL-103 TaxID=2819156 RepID=UPI001BE77043|nr:hypothetical protein [Microbacterium sp. ISL-103]MBT2473279.1 hypothetical protein [Microbacterium sp. ISL-103]
MNFLQDERKPGWFRFSADLLNLSSEGQEGVAHALEHVAAMTAKDGAAHTSFTAFAGAWGYPTLFIGSKPALMPATTASEHLARYAVLKKHQIKSDRALMVLIDENEHIHSIRYDYSEPVDNEILDDAAAMMRLIPPEVMGRMSLHLTTWRCTSVKR